MKDESNVSAENSFNIMSDFPEFVDGPRYMELYNEADLSRNPNKSKKINYCIRTDGSS